MDAKGNAGILYCNRVTAFVVDIFVVSIQIGRANSGGWNCGDICSFHIYRRLDSREIDEEKEIPLGKYSRRPIFSIAFRDFLRHISRI